MVGMGIFHKLLKQLNASQKIALTFFLVIVSGTLLLMLPISNQEGTSLSIIDALFTATSATCVTGLVTIVPAEQFTMFGQSVLIVLFELGGLGLMTFMALLVLLFRQKLPMQEKKAVKELLNQDRVKNIKHFIRGLIGYSFLFEGIGTLLLAIRFVPELGWKDGLFRSLFLSVSAFCNAGFDNVGSQSLQGFRGDGYVLIIIAMLIILGGLGFAVWFELRDSFVPFLKRKITFAKMKRGIHTHTKIVLSMTLGLIVIPAVLIFILEFHNMSTIGDWSVYEKMLAAFFESVTLRTAGFASIDYSSIVLGTRFMMLFVMFVGGSSGGTAGGVKTTTIAVCFAYLKAMIQGKQNTVLFHRVIPTEIVIRSLSLVAINAATLIIGVFLLCITESHGFIELVFEAVSALATVGLTLGITSSLSVFGKLIIISMMYIGRIGILTLLMSFSRKRKNNKQKDIVYPIGNVIVG